MSLIVDLVGKRFGRLTVVRRANGYKDHRLRWACLCDCGQEKVVLGDSLKCGRTQSCGCILKEQNKIPEGSRFGFLTVLNMEPSRKYQTRCRVNCDCGSEFVVNTAALRSGHTSGCGKNCPCRTADSAKKVVIGQYKTGAKLRGLFWGLSDKQFFELASQSCFYCGQQPGNVCRSNSENPSIFVYNGVDRVDNNVGYDLSNCVPCCKNCNLSKLNRSCADFIEWAHRLSKHLREKNL